MDVSYRRDKDHNYMILDAPGELTGEEYQVRMLVGNHIPHLLKCNRRMMDGKAVFFMRLPECSRCSVCLKKGRSIRKKWLNFCRISKRHWKTPRDIF